MATGKHSAAAVVHGLRAWRLLLLPSIIGVHMRALNGVACAVIPPDLQRESRLRPHLATALALGEAERSS